MLWSAFLQFPFFRPWSDVIMEKLTQNLGLKIVKILPVFGRFTLALYVPILISSSNFEGWITNRIFQANKQRHWENVKGIENLS